ncbi:MAG: putative zinc-binding protein [Nitrospinota bacterium]
MSKSSPSFTIEVEGVKGSCAAGDKYGSANMAGGKIPVLSCEGACVKGEVARLAANMVGKEEPYRRACHGEIMTVPYSSQSEWAKKAEKTVVIDGCFLRCHGRMLKDIVGGENLIQFDALSISKKYTDLYGIDEVPEEERIETARMVANTALARLKEHEQTAEQSVCG